ncbi:putative peptidase family M28 [Podospora aff. communis PSN243]|uniref:Peptide hydrolase n=1 Tax=Podospora aff. communis PSN243 TaxID=3040156 RepID=A0AAV9H490_9PEZI|nr:putative peptidase family M28 [Podospora aff. communis PSN243]
MHSSALFLLSISSACLVTAAPSAPGAGLSLIKSSPTDPGTWVTEEQKITEYHAKDINFVDITGISDPEVLAYYSLPEKKAPSLSARAVTYPSNISHRAEADALIAQLSTSNLQSWAKTLTDFQTRHYQSTFGVEAATWLSNHAKSISASNPAITVSEFTHSRSKQPSIIVRVPGSVTSSLVILGAHFDSINDRSSSLSARAPGAIDNASGVVVLLETLRTIASSGLTPKATLEFHFYAAEEGGMIGSAEVFAKYKADAKTVLAMVNTDMAGYSPSGKISIWTDEDGVDQALTRYVRTVAEAYTGETTEDTCGTRMCSDHNSATSNGFPAAYVCDEKRRTAFKVHNENDSYDKLQWDTVLRHTKFLTAFVVEASYLSG